MIILSDGPGLRHRYSDQAFVRLRITTRRMRLDVPFLVIKPEHKSTATTLPLHPRSSAVSG